MNHLATALGLILGLLVGLVAAATDIGVLDRFAEGVAPLGTLFINAIRMVVIPLVVTTIFVGVARLGNPKTVGKLGGSALGFFWGTTVPAIVIGVVFMKITLGIWPATVQVASTGEAPPEIPGLLDFFLRLIPANPFAAASDGALLPLIVFTLLVAAAAGALAEDRRRRLITLAEDISTMFVKLIDWILVDGPRRCVRAHGADHGSHGPGTPGESGRIRGHSRRGPLRFHRPLLPALGALPG